MKGQWLNGKFQSGASLIPINRVLLLTQCAEAMIEKFGDDTKLLIKMTAMVADIGRLIMSQKHCKWNSYQRDEHM